MKRYAKRQAMSAAAAWAAAGSAALGVVVVARMTEEAALKTTRCDDGLWKGTGVNWDAPFSINAAYVLMQGGIALHDPCTYLGAGLVTLGGVMVLEAGGVAVGGTAIAGPAGLGGAALLAFVGVAVAAVGAGLIYLDQEFIAPMLRQGADDWYKRTAWSY